MRISNARRLGAHTITNFVGMTFALAAVFILGISGMQPAFASAATTDTASKGSASPTSAPQSAAPSPSGPYYGSGKGYVKYYSPGDGNLDGYEPWDPNAYNPPAAIVSPRGEWAAGSTPCGLYHATDAPDRASGLRLTTLVSLGAAHLGVTGYLEHGWNPTQYDYVVLFDPGSYNKSACDNRVRYNDGISQATTYARWLKANPDSHLVVFAGSDTRDAQHPAMVNGKRQYHQGLRREVFAKLTSSQKQRVVVCGYADMNNPMVAQNFLSYMNRAKITSPSQCPQNPDRSGAAVNAWRP